MIDLANEPWPRRFPWLGPITILIAVTLVLSALFLAVPGLDLWFSRQFYDAEIGFPASRVPAFVWLRWLSEAIIWVIAGILLLSVLFKLILPRRRSLVPVRTTLFLSGTLALGPGLLVNGLLKSFWGRPRPVEITEFGGEHPFVSAWHMSDFCATNCSFVSGEASFGIWLLALAFVVRPRLRTAVLVGAGVLAFIFSINRIAFGGHFLSDVLISWALTLLIIALAYRFLFIRPPAWLHEDSLEAALTGAGLGIRNLIQRRPIDFGTGAAAGAAVIPSVHEARAEIGPHGPLDAAPETPELTVEPAGFPEAVVPEREIEAPAPRSEDLVPGEPGDPLPAPDLRPEHGGANAEPGSDIEWLAAAEHAEAPVRHKEQPSPPADHPAGSEESPGGPESATAKTAKLPSLETAPDGHLGPLAAELGGSDALEEERPPFPLPAIIPEDEKDRPA